MPSVPHIRMRRILSAAAIAAAVTLALAACGSSGDEERDPRPPSPLVVTASISHARISISPASFGAGPVTLVVTNQSTISQRVTFASTGSQASFTQQTGPINPRDTATLRADIPPGNAVVKVDTRAIRPTRITVGPRRASAQDELLQP